MWLLTTVDELHPEGKPQLVHRGVAARSWHLVVRLQVNLVVSVAHQVARARHVSSAVGAVISHVHQHLAVWNYRIGGDGALDVTIGGTAGAAACKAFA